MSEKERKPRDANQEHDQKLVESGEEKPLDPDHVLIKGLTPEQSKAIFENPDLSGLTQEEIRARVEARVAEEEERRRAKKKEPAAPLPPGEVDSDFVLDCLAQNEVGDGRLYAALHQGRYLYNKTDQNWYKWSGHHWERDIMNSSLAAVENVTERYLKEAVNLSYKRNDAVKDGKDEEVKKIKADIELVYKRASRLRTDRGRRNCVACAHTKHDPLAVPGDGFDLNPWVVACKNGVLDLRTGELRPGRPEEFILRACPHDWQGINAPAPKFVKFLQTTFEDNQELIAYLGRLFGYALSGLIVHRKFIMLYGQGQNGKGLLIETLLHVLGPLAAPIQSEMLLDQGRSRSAAGPSPDIMALKGLRMAVASETDEGRRFSIARVQWLSGGDTLVGRAPFAQQEISFTPTHTLFLLTNNKPHTSSYAFAIWERMILIPFKISFVNRTPRAENERPADLYLQEELAKEASGILAWLVRGFIQWSERGLDPPPCVLDATAEYKREEDILEDFIEEHCYRNPEAKSGASDLYDTFNEWFLKNVSKKGMSQKKFGRLLQAAGFEKVKSGTFSYLGIGLLAG